MTFLRMMALRDAARPLAAAMAERDQCQQQAFSTMMQGIAVVAAVTHVFFLALFWWARVDVLAIFNVASVLSYVWIFIQTRRGRLARSLAAALAEIMAHAILAAAMIGWESGFHLYILLVIPVAVVSTIRPLSLKVLTVAGVAATYLVLDMLVRHAQPPEVLPAHVLDGLHYFNLLSAMVILVFLSGYYYYLNAQAEKALREMAATDPLTNLRNRRSMVEAMRHELRRVQRTREPLAFALADIDHFKTINDAHGHEVGDEVLQAISQALVSSVRAIDYVARWGGEEFLIMMPGTPAEGAQVVAERMRSRVAAIEVPVKGQTVRTSITLGVSLLGENESAEQAIARADQALYDGKHAGRDRVVLAGGPTGTSTPQSDPS